MLINVEPMDEQTVAQSLFLIARLAEVKHGLTTVDRKELLDDGEDGLSEFLVSRRTPVTFDVDVESRGQILS